QRIPVSEPRSFEKIQLNVTFRILELPAPLHDTGPYAPVPELLRTALRGAGHQHRNCPREFAEKRLKIFASFGSHEQMQEVPYVGVLINPNPPAGSDVDQ